MSDRPLAAVVLAAGQGKRMRAPGPKVLVEAAGRTLVEHVLEAAAPLHAQPVVIVHGHGGSAVQQALHARDLRFAHQPEQRGTGHAVQCALPALDGFAGDVLVLCGDTPLLEADVLAALVADHRAAGRALTVLSAEVSHPGSLGRVLRGADGRLHEIREMADATPEERGVREINTGVMVIGIEHLADALGRLTPDNAQGEYYLTDVPGLLLGDGLAVEAWVAPDEWSALGVNDPSELALAVRILRRRIRARLAADGVWFDDPETAIIDAGAEIGAGTRLGPFVHVGADVRIGKDCRLGPHASLREGVVVGDGVRLGSHVEVADATLEAGADVPGPARIVGAAVGRGAYLGPGTLTSAESNGRIVIGENARIGAGTILRGPVTVAENETVEPRSCLEGGAHA